MPRVVDHDERRRQIARVVSDIAAERGLSDVGAEFLHQAAVMRGTGAELIAVRRDLAVDARRAHAP